MVIMPVQQFIVDSNSPNRSEYYNLKLDTSGAVKAKELTDYNKKKDKNNPNKEVVCVLVKNFSWQHFEQFKNLTNLNDEDFEKLKDASTLFELTSKQFIPYYIENKGKENAKRYLQPINKWEYEEDAFVEIINNLSKILSK